MSRPATSAYIDNGKIQFLTESRSKHKLKTSPTNDNFTQVEKQGDTFMGITDTGWIHTYNENGDLKHSKRN